MKKYLTDKGAGQPPLEYVVALEQGLREYACVDRAAFGTYSNFNFEEYTKVELWRKREAYIGLVRYILGKGNYSKYVNYNWCDYTLRLSTSKTFMKRHWPVTNGDVLLKGLVDPVHWKANKGIDCRKRSQTGRVTFQTPVAPEEEEEEEEDGESLEWDSAEGEWVEKK